MNGTLERFRNPTITDMITVSEQLGAAANLDDLVKFGDRRQIRRSQMFIKLAFEFGCDVILMSHSITQSLGSKQQQTLIFAMKYSFFTNQSGAVWSIDNYYRHKTPCGIRKLTVAFVSEISRFVSRFSWSLAFGAKMSEFPLPLLQTWRSRKRVAIQIQLMNIHVSECKYYCLRSPKLAAAPDWWTTPYVTSSLSVFVNANPVESCFEKRVQLVQFFWELSEFKLNQINQYKWWWLKCTHKYDKKAQVSTIMRGNIP